MSGAAEKVIEVSQRISALPPSVDGSAALYAYALFGLTVLFCIASSVTAWMSRDLYRDRLYVHPLSALTAFRLIMFFSGITGVIRTGPEIAYMMAYNEGPTSLIASIMFMKRIADSMASFSGLAWSSILVLAYPSISSALRRCDDRSNFGAMARKLVRPAILMGLFFLLALLMALGKVLQGVPVAPGA
jgi:hypothetical protein